MLYPKYDIDPSCSPGVIAVFRTTILEVLQLFPGKCVLVVGKLVQFGLHVALNRIYRIRNIISE